MAGVLARGMQVRSWGSCSLRNMGAPAVAEGRGARHHLDLMTAAVPAVWWQGLVRVRSEWRAARSRKRAPSWRNDQSVQGPRGGHRLVWPLLRVEQREPRHAEGPGPAHGAVGRPPVAMVGGPSGRQRRRWRGEAPRPVQADEVDEVESERRVVPGCRSGRQLVPGIGLHDRAPSTRAPRFGKLTVAVGIRRRGPSPAWLVRSGGEVKLARRTVKLLLARIRKRLCSSALLPHAAALTPVTSA